ncbi:hypothetical protein [Paenibacillus turpanensis]|uniref:hypothetical protein n=1 Tax=Paenibacillus turpanensis TaxID=2689078 RepID=UPI00140A68BE|nr:hypothetical protein [Paenibacillus turpanensis]
MKKYLLGGVIGAMLTIAIPTSFANQALTTVQAYLWDATLRINNNGDINSSDGIEILNYKDTAYVPLRYISEHLGATVTYVGDHPQGPTIHVDYADERDLTIKTPDGIIGMGNFEFAHGNRSWMTVQVKQYQEINNDNYKLYIYFYDKQGNFIFKQWLSQLKCEVGKVHTNMILLEANIEGVDASKTKIELISK